MYVFVSPLLPWHPLAAPAQARQGRQMVQKGGGDGDCIKQVRWRGNEVRELRVIIMMTHAMQDRLLTEPNIKFLFPI